ncbi:TonB-dependent receptor [Candidatus Nitronereus thalassa]|uniref:TonB-dependent receptor n=1 Tax=Candidatus Nitronereus thalassa TaxID=3020898 RepID=A0ABU3KBQ9_9BACT|nr:TonB-dependent receptor [Candidatus Nitronereus thalassa]MDT7043934.1 TonB-dependent receptor [Candidatus Nitronereus thalassa]
MSYLDKDLKKTNHLKWLFLGLAFTFIFGFLEDSYAVSGGQKIAGHVQNVDLRRVAQATVELRDQEGALVTSESTDDAGEFILVAPGTGVFSIRAIQETYRSEYKIVEVGNEEVGPVVLTMTVTQEIALEVVAPLLPIQPKSSSETYSLSRTEIEALPFGSNIEFNDALLTIPGAVNGSLKQVHIRQDHANFQVRIDGVPIPDTVSSTFTDVISPRAWERADIILGGMEAQFGNRTAAVIDITSKSGTKPGFGSIQLFGGSNETVIPSFEYGGTAGDKFRYYVLNSYTTTSRGIDPPTLGDSGFHNESDRNQTFIRGDYQLNNNNNFTLLFLNSIAKFQIPNTPNQIANGTIVGLIQANNPGFNPVISQDIDESQKETNQYAHLVWRHDVNASQFFSLAGYLRHTRATFETDPLNVLAYTGDTDEPFSAGDQDRFAYSNGVRLDYTNVLNSEHLVKAGFQFDRTQAVNKTELFAFNRVGGAPMGSVLMRRADSRLIGYREEFWVQDQYTPNDQWTFNLGVRVDNIHGFIEAAQISPRVGATFKATNNHAFHAFYGRLFTPPNLEAIRFVQLNTVGTTAEPENLTNNTVKPERSHYFEVGSTHAFGQIAVVQLTGYYKLSKNLSDAGQFGTTPLLNFFAFKNGWQRGIEGSIKVKLTDNLSARGNVAWGQCKGQGLQSGHFLLEQQEINDIETSEGVFCDHMQEVTSSAILTYRLLEHTTVSGQMLFGSGLRTASAGEKTNSQSADSVTTYNLSLTHVLPLSGKQRLLFGFDMINVFDQQELLNIGEQSIGLGVSHANMPRSFFFRTQWFFDS